MGVLKAADFYYGAFLSALLNYAGKKPSLFDEIPKGKDRRIYRLTTQNSPQEYIIYTKYVNIQKNKSTDVRHWIFGFSSEELQKIIDLKQQGYDIKFAFICVQEDLKGCELAVVDYNRVLKCIGIEKGIKKTSYRINIKAFGKKHGLRMYGSGLSDKTDGRDTMLKLDRDALKDL